MLATVTGIATVAGVIVVSVHTVCTSPFVLPVLRSIILRLMICMQCWLVVFPCSLVLVWVLLMVLPFFL